LCGGRQVRRTPATRPGWSISSSTFCIDGDDVAALPLIERKAQLAELLSGAASPLQYGANSSPR
jgi:hypothetical protein